MWALQEEEGYETADVIKKLTTLRRILEEEEEEEEEEDDFRMLQEEEDCRMLQDEEEDSQQRTSKSLVPGIVDKQEATGDKIENKKEIREEHRGGDGDN